VDTKYPFKGTFLGGLDPGADVLNRKNNTTLLSAQNIMYSKPVSYLSGVSTKKFVATTPPPSKKISSDSYQDGTFIYPYTFPYNSPVYQKTIAAFEHTDWPSETWVMSGSGTASLVAAISEGDECLSLACTAGQTAVGTGTLNPVSISPVLYSVLSVDSQWNNITNFSSGYIRVGSDSSNYYQWAVIAPSEIGNIILKFDWAIPSSTVGSPNLGAIDYSEISLTAGAGGSITVKFDNLRLASFASIDTSIKTLIPNACNVYSGFILDTDVNTSASNLIFNTSDTLFLASLGAALTSSVIKSGFANVSPRYELGTSFYYSQFPKSGSVYQNVLYYVNGHDGYFSYDSNASAGSRHARISAVNYKYICSHKNMMFLIHVDEPNTIYVSDVNDPTTITAGNAVVIPSALGTYITGIYSVDDYSLITRNTDKWVLYGSNPDSTTGDFVLKKTKSKYGCVEQYAGCRVGSMWA
jgi:hypothetical protein